MNAVIESDICIIGAGPVGLFAVFEAGLLKMRCHLVDALPQVGGQLSEIYPKKPIYDIPGYPEIKAEELIVKLQEQIAPFKPSFTLGERVESFNRLENGSFVLKTSDHTEIKAKVAVIAGGLGCFEPRKPELERLDYFEGKGVVYMVKDPEQFRDKKLVIAGGGDSALDWAIYLSDIANQLTLVHRNEMFRGSPDSAEKVFQAVKAGKINLLLKSDLLSLHGNGNLESVHVKTSDGQVMEIETEYLIPLFGLSPKLGPIATWGLNLDRNTIKVNTLDYSTNIPGIYAIGDSNTYPGKLKLILSGFHESAIMMHSAFHFVFPDQKPGFKYTTVTGIHGF